MGDPAVRVWATGDGVRVNPVTGKYLEDRPDIHKDCPSGDYSRRNAVWDAAGSKVTLAGARNEFVAFQVIVAADRPVGGVKVRFPRPAISARRSGRGGTPTRSCPPTKTTA